MNEINLLPHVRESLVKSQRAVRIIRLISAVFLFLTAASSLGLFFLNLSSPLSSLKQEENKLLSELSLHKEKMENMLVAKERLKYISGILAKRRNYETEIELITSQLPSQVTVDSFSASQNAITITASSDSLFSLNKFTDHLTDITLNKKIFDKVSFDNLVFDGTNSKYSLSIKADYYEK
ncbi:MAG: hypothetical protein Q7S38_00800 [bacterium]|nr:hypothetical protein [bacterium]